MISSPPDSNPALLASLLFVGMNPTTLRVSPHAEWHEREVQIQVSKAKTHVQGADVQLYMRVEWAHSPEIHQQKLTFGQL